MPNLKELGEKIRAAVDAGVKAADAQPNDGGSANLDHVVIYGLKGVRESALQNAGVQCSRVGVGKFALSAPYKGQGQRRTVGVEKTAEELRKAGVDCYVHYQMD